ncbi:50S ribosomal protein L9 [Halanaerobacter jeridensis]|uniref:Large ribosomal subunit protein bL9 n=1 Tax=Halanaerobacter jeridensis TaxID=706427 RepID=A0A938XPY2_9FIRM|nr:50S ribosomal protein L9 [Halanaerobacter jeridensis]MBM7557608.1 large subunit ribosomal protein L9 [Halanaerobacter jeridensis]
MKVILQEDVSNLGNKGDVVEAADGHARNYLLPRGLAKEATKQNLNNLEQKKKSKQKQKEEERKEAQKKAEELEGLVLEIAVKAGDNNRLFGSVTSMDIADEIEAETGEKIDKRNIDLDENIKNLGVKPVDIKLHKDVTATVKVKVIEA